MQSGNISFLPQDVTKKVKLNELNTSVSDSVHKSGYSFKDMLEKAQNENDRKSSADKKVDFKSNRVDSKSNNSLKKTENSFAAKKIDSKKVIDSNQELSVNESGENNNTLFYPQINSSSSMENSFQASLNNESLNELSLVNPAVDSSVYQNTFYDLQKNISEGVMENIDLTTEQLNYLKMNENGKDEFDSLLEEIQDYSLTEESLLDSAQNFSVSEPEEFLNQLSLVAENEAPVQNANNPLALNKNGKNDSASFSLENDKAENKNKFFSITVESDKVKENGVFEVTDLRSFEEKIKAASKNEKAPESLDLTVSLSDSAKQNILSLDNQTAASNGSAFQQMLTQAVETSVPDFVKAGSIILRDNDSGTINMNLKPEALGNVKLTLQVSDKVITGQITVSSKEAFEAFKQNLDSFKQAFQENGFDQANLTLAMQQNAANSGFANSESQNQSNEYMSNKTYRNYVSDSSEAEDSVNENYSDAKNYNISVVA